jgi:hypothetical protein
LVVGGFLAVFFGFLNPSRDAGPYKAGAAGVTCTGGCERLTRFVLVAKVSIAKGTSGTEIARRELYSFTSVRAGGRIKDAFVDPNEFRSEVTTRTIPAGARLTAADFALRGPIYYPRGYPKRVPASQIPAKMSRYLPAQSFPSDLAVAPGVWVDGSPSEATLDKHVANGTLVGYCPSVRAFQAHNPEIPFATKCWRP